MQEVVDARGLACPHPVILTKKALEDADEVITIVDNETAVENVSRLAASQGCNIVVQKHDDGIYIRLVKKITVSREPAAAPVSKSTVLLITSDSMGRGEEELGNSLMRNFIYMIGEVTPRPDKIVFLNSGVKLVAEESDVTEDLLDLTKKGVEILACGTCLDYFNLKEAVKVGRISNMYEISSALMQSGRTITI